jgi:hypothetical protein
MPFRTIPGCDTRYGLLSFDANGEERRDDPDGTMSQRLLEAAPGATNIFLFSHGWMGDVPAAIDQYDRWIRAFDTLASGRRRAPDVFPGFQPLYIGLHWPSRPWGDEALSDGSFSVEESSGGNLFEEIAAGLEDTPAVRAALQTILEDARHNAAADTLTPQTREAFLDLRRALELEEADHESIGPDELFEAAGEASFGGAGMLGGVLNLLRTCSYWTKKKLARRIGEGGMHEFVKSLQRATTARFHLMGHSFGCIVISSILGGPGARAPLERPVDSVVLVQGAVSYWSYSPAIPIEGAGAGYFHRILPDGKIRGPLVVTRSRHDTAVGRMYPLASAVSGSPSFDVEEQPKYGAIGTFGLQGLPDGIKVDRAMLPAGGEYRFGPGKVYNLESSAYIAKGGGASGAHNDIDGPEVAHAIWQAAFASA